MSVPTTLIASEPSVETGGLQMLAAVGCYHWTFFAAQPSPP